MTEATDPITRPPADLPEIQRGNWFSVPADDPVALYLDQAHFGESRERSAWRAARLSSAVYLYKRVETEWSITVKYYGMKTGVDGPKYATQEYDLNQRAYSVYLTDRHYRAVKPLDLWGDVLFLEYVDGLTLEDTIAIRKSRPGVLLESLDHTAKLMAKLHSNHVDGVKQRDYSIWIHKTRKILDNLSKHGVLEDEPLIQEGLAKIITRWENFAWMQDYQPAPMHGDTTTSNFVFPWDGGIVAIDWERAGYADPAFDLGRLLAEISHSINSHGGDNAESAAFTHYMAEIYHQSLSADAGFEALLQRARFYQASSSLRIARNGWVPREVRLQLVGQAFALLSE